MRVAGRQAKISSLAEHPVDKCVLHLSPQFGDLERGRGRAGYSFLFRYAERIPSSFTNSVPIGDQNLKSQITNQQSVVPLRSSETTPRESRSDMTMGGHADPPLPRVYLSSPLSRSTLWANSQNLGRGRGWGRSSETTPRESRADTTMGGHADPPLPRVHAGGLFLRRILSTLWNLWHLPAPGSYGVEPQTPQEPQIPLNPSCSACPPCATKW